MKAPLLALGLSLLTLTSSYAGSCQDKYVAR